MSLSKFRRKSALLATEGDDTNLGVVDSVFYELSKNEDDKLYVITLYKLKHFVKGKIFEFEKKLKEVEKDPKAKQLRKELRNDIECYKEAMSIYHHCINRILKFYDDDFLPPFKYKNEVIENPNPRKPYHGAWRVLPKQIIFELMGNWADYD